MDSVPTLLMTFKVLVLGTGMFFAIRWHYEQGKKHQEKGSDRRELLRAGGKIAGVFALALLALLVFVFGLGKILGLNLAFS